MGEIDPLVIMIAALIIVLIIFIGIITLRPSSTVRDAETLSRVAAASTVSMQQEIDRKSAALRMNEAMVEDLRNQVRNLGGKTITQEVAAERANVPMAIFADTNRVLRDVLVSMFDVSEMNILSRDVGIDPGELRGDTKTELAVEIIERSKRLGLMGKLLHEIKRARPLAKVNGD